MIALLLTLPHRRAARDAGRPRARGRRGPAAGGRGRAASLPRARGELPARARRRRRSRTPSARSSRLLIVFACLGTAAVIARAGSARVAAPPPGDAAERGRDLVPAPLRGRAAREPGAAAVARRLLAAASSRPRFLAGLLRSRLARGGLADLFGEMPDDARHRAAGAAGQGRRRPEPRRRLPRPAGGLRRRRRRAVALPPGPGRSVAPLRRRARSSTTRRSTRIRGWSRPSRAAATIALEHEQLAGRLAAASRQRLVAAGDAERRRLERDLHDGAQQRLVTVAIQLRLIQADIRRDPAAAEALVTSASGELARSLEELRELARGIHPAVLDHGLASALTSLAARSAVPTAVSCERRRAAAARRARAVLRRLRGAGQRRQVRAGDRRLDPPDPDRAAASRSRSPTTASAARARRGGSGLRGLQDRVEALAGHLLVTSPAGAGTVVSAELPCAS